MIKEAIIRTKLQILAQKMVFDKQGQKAREAREPYIAEWKEKGVNNGDVKGVSLLIQPGYNETMATMLQLVLNQLDKGTTHIIIIGSLAKTMGTFTKKMLHSKDEDEKLFNMVSGYAVGNVAKWLMEYQFEIPEIMTLGEEIK